MKKLPKVFQNTVQKPRNNNKEYFYSAKDEYNNIPIQEHSIEEELDDIFNGIGYPFSDIIIIKTNNHTYETNLIYRTNKNVMTIDNDNIPIDSITSIRRKI